MIASWLYSKPAGCCSRIIRQEFLGNLVRDARAPCGIANGLGRFHRVDWPSACLDGQEQNPSRDRLNSARASDLLSRLEELGP